MEGTTMPHLSGAAGALVALVLVAGSTGCTAHRSPAAAPAPTASASGSPQPTHAPPSAPQRTSVTHVAGSLDKPHRALLARHVGRTISAYVDAAFLGGGYPRSDFSSSFGAFTAGARADARHDQDLLTNRPFGASTTSVRATRRTAYLSVLAPKGRVAGVTAAVDLELLVDRGRRPGRHVHLAGRLLLTPTSPGRWSIFGYDLHRSDTPARSAS
jgi:hypothetical protein